MTRLLLIFILLFYILYKFGFFRALFSSSNSPNERRPPNSNVNVNSNPDQQKKKSSFKGGEYIDYEEVK